MKIIKVLDILSMSNGTIHIFNHFNGADYGYFNRFEIHHYDDNILNSKVITIQSETLNENEHCTCLSIDYKA